MMKELIEKLGQLERLLSEGGETYYMNYIQKALDGGEDNIWKFLCSNELWGGVGSVADQAVLENKSLRKEVEQILIEIGELQQKMGRANERTEMWVSAFSQWKEQGII